MTTGSIANAQKSPERAFAEEEQLQSLLIDEQGKRMDAGETAALIGTKLSGLAMWPTLVCDGSEGTLIVSRGRNGEAQKSHWQTVLQLMSDEPPRRRTGRLLASTEAKPECAAVTEGDDGPWGAGSSAGNSGCASRRWRRSRGAYQAQANYVAEIGGRGSNKTGFPVTFFVRPFAGQDAAIRPLQATVSTIIQTLSRDNLQKH